MEFNQSISPQWSELPRDLISNVLQRLGTVEILENAQRVCKTWRAACKEDPSMWRVIHMKNSTQAIDNYEKFEIMCRNAVDRSQGQLIDLNIRYFGTAELLQYISDRSSQLKHLTLGNCQNISSNDVVVAANKLPHLESLFLICIHNYIGKEDIKAITSCCPMLKSFDALW